MINSLDQKDFFVLIETFIVKIKDANTDNVLEIFEYTQSTEIILKNHLRN